MKSRLRSVAGAYCRSSLIFLTDSEAPAPGWPIAQRKTRRQTAKERTRRYNRIVDHSRL
jgi:hypothetical protein